MSAAGTTVDATTRPWGMPVPLGNEILAVVTHSLLRASEGRGLDRATLLRQAGLTEDSLDPDGWLDIDQHLRVGHAMASALPGQNLGLQTGAPIYSDPRGALGYCLRRSQTNSRALQAFGAYVMLVNRAARVLLAQEPAGMSVVLELAPQMESARHPAEAILAGWLALSRHLTGSRWHPLKVELVHSPVGDTTEHAAVFGCPVDFGSSRTRMVLSPSVADLPIPVRSHELDVALGRAVQRAHDLLEDDGSRAVLSEVGGWLLASPLDITPKRIDQAPGRLAARLAVAKALLEDTDVYVHEAAYLLAFDSLGAFEQAFSERFGLPPTRARRVREQQRKG
jgi:hypothetical protein